MRWCGSQGPLTSWGTARLFFGGFMFGSAFWKTFFILLVLVIALFLFLEKSNGEEMLVETTWTNEKDEPKDHDKDRDDDVGDLTYRMGVTVTSANPCFDLDGYILKYCTKHNLQALIAQKNFTSAEEQLYKKFLEDPNTCDHVAEYIGHACELENFGKILKHFSKKQ